MTSLFRLHKKQLEASFRARTSGSGDDSDFVSDADSDSNIDLDSRNTVRPVRFYLAVVLLFFCFATLAGLSMISKSPVWRLVVLFLVAHLPYAYSLISTRRGFPLSFRLGHIILISVLFRGMLVAAPPTFSDDIYRYIWDGRVLQSGVNPYKYAPADEALQPLKDSNWSQINHKELKTIYPPVSEMLFAAIAVVSDTPTAFKTVTAAADIGIIVFIYLLLGGTVGRKNARPDAGRQDAGHTRAIRGALAYGFNPLACVETAMSGHLEPLALLGILAAFYTLKVGRNKLSTLFLSLAVAIKLAPLLLLPSFARRRIGTWVSVLLLLGLSYAAFSLDAGTGTVETLDTYARRWEGNGGLFVVVKSVCRSFLESATGATNDTDIVHLPLLDRPATMLHGTFFSLHKDGAFRPEAPGSFPLLDLTLALAKVIMGIVLMGVFFFVIIKQFTPIRAASWIFATLVLVTPVLHPWYILWILPFGIMNGHWPWTVLAGLSGLAYLPLDGWWSSGVWQTPLYIPIIEYGGFLLAVILFWVLDRRRK